MSRIIALDIEGFKRIKAVRIRPDGRLVQITGKNASGKTSCLDAILVAIKGMAAFRGQSEPINIDSERAMIRLDLGDIIVTRVFRRPKPGSKSQEITTEVRVENKDGFRAPEPQKLLEGLIGPHTLDPLQFTRLDEDKQLDTLRGFVPDFDFDANIKERKVAYEGRTVVNRQAKDADAIAAAVKLPDDIAADATPIDEAALTEELASASETNSGIERRKANREAARRQMDALVQSVVDLKDGLEGKLRAVDERFDLATVETEQQIAELQARIETLKGRLATTGMEREAALRFAREQVSTEVEAAETEARKIRDALEAAGALPEPVDVQAVMASLNDARRINASLRVRADHALKLEAARKLHAEADDLTKEIEALDKKKADAIAAAKLPVPGLTIGDDGILLDGLPFSQASDAQRLRTSCAIAMALNSELRVLRVRDGSLLDPDGLALLAAMAEEHDYDIWIERVDVSGTVGIVLEDGYVRGQAPTEEQPQGALV